jgi:transposase
VDRSRNTDPGWLQGVPAECVYDNLRTVVAKRERDEVRWNPRFLHLRGHYAFHATACTPATPREKGSVEGGVRHVKTGFCDTVWIVQRGTEVARLTRWRSPRSPTRSCAPLRLGRSAPSPTKP